jgi:uncharacterized protein (TIGR02996 family)
MADITYPESAFREAQLAGDNDDAPWLMFADWLDDHGDSERAQLFRQRFVTNSAGIRFALVPRGTFWMSRDGKNAQRQVEILHDFYMGVYPVTQAEWQAVMGNNPSYFSRSGGGGDRIADLSDEQIANLPVEQVSWHDAQKFIARLNEREKDSGWVYSLPTEAQWEYACRAAAQSKDECSFDYYSSNGPTNSLTRGMANFNYYLGSSSPVGAYPPNRLGLCDMHGNVWEWCLDKYYEEGEYSPSPPGVTVSHGGGHGTAPTGVVTQPIVDPLVATMASTVLAFASSTLEEDENSPDPTMPSAAAAGSTSAGAAGRRTASGTSRTTGTAASGSASPATQEAEQCPDPTNTTVSGGAGRGSASARTAARQAAATATRTTATSALASVSSVFQEAEQRRGPYTSRVLRGGSWVNDGRLCRSAYRDWLEPFYWYQYCGFRLIRHPGG